MPRTARSVRGGMIYHVLNRGNGGTTVFHKPGDYEAFLHLLDEGREQASVSIFAFCLMPNHWHLVVQPTGDEDLSRYLAWVCTAHVRRYHRHYENTKGGHLYQGRFKCFPIQTGHHLLTVLRYVEANPLRAGLVEQAQRWNWSSAATELTGVAKSLLTAWPIERPPNWIEMVNTAVNEPDLDQIRASVNRGRPFGDDTWAAAEAIKRDT